MGTDSGSFANRFQGYFEHLELEMMADSGLTPEHVLRSATSDAARAMNASEIGSLKPGNWADFVVLDRDPLLDIKNARSIASVWISGNLIKQ
jgi:imidazolonepropionase-like amidohydrolase